MSHNYLSPKAATRPMSLARRGTFARAEIHEGETIAIFGGHVVTLQDCRMLPKKVLPYLLQIEKDLFIGPVREDEIGDGDFINHSCAPNAGIVGQIALIAIRHILPNEEITFDYGTVVSKKGYRIRCACGAAGCRRWVTHKDWQSESLRKRYGEFFSAYLLRKIERMEKQTNA